MDKNKHDDGKIRPTLIPTSALRYISMVREYGLKKYPETGREGWKEVGRERITDALFRHLINYIEDPDGFDEESGLPIIAHIACNASFLCWFDEEERGNDDISETYSIPYADFLREFPCSAMALDKFIKQGNCFKKQKGDNT